MRVIRLFFVAVLAIILIIVALANREIVTLNAFPAQFDQYVGGTWSARMPLFLVILMSVLFGMVVGLIWEWLREAHIRSEASRRRTEVARLEREVGHLRDTHSSPRDDVLAIMDAPRQPRGTAPNNPALPSR